MKNPLARVRRVYKCEILPLLVSLGPVIALYSPIPSHLIRVSAVRARIRVSINRGGVVADGEIQRVNFSSCFKLEQRKSTKESAFLIIYERACFQDEDLYRQVTSLLSVPPRSGCHYDEVRLCCKRSYPHGVELAARGLKNFPGMTRVFARDESARVRARVTPAISYADHRRCHASRKKPPFRSVYIHTRALRRRRLVNLLRAGFHR